MVYDIETLCREQTQPFGLEDVAAPMLTSTPKQIVLDSNWTLVNPNMSITERQLTSEDETGNSVESDEADDTTSEEHMSRKLYFEGRRHRNGQVPKDAQLNDDVWRPW